MGFQIEHDNWISKHLRRRKGERLDALKRGHGYGNRLSVERVWWSLVGNFHGLHPEYEVKDWRGRSYFVDFMWIVGAFRIVFEIMDYGSHGTDRSKYRMDLNRGLFLQAQDCTVFYISLDELKENPAFILSALRNILSPYLSAGSGTKRTVERFFSKIERDLMRAAIRHNRTICPTEAAKELDLSQASDLQQLLQPPSRLPHCWSRGFSGASATVYSTSCLQIVEQKAKKRAATAHLSVTRHSPQTRVPRGFKASYSSPFAIGLSSYEIQSLQLPL